MPRHLKLAATLACLSLAPTQLACERCPDAGNTDCGPPFELFVNEGPFGVEVWRVRVTVAGEVHELECRGGTHCITHSPDIVVSLNGDQLHVSAFGEGSDRQTKTLLTPSEVSLEMWSPDGTRYFRDYALDPDFSATCIHCEYFHDWVSLDELDSEPGEAGP